MKGPQDSRSQVPRFVGPFPGCRSQAPAEKKAVGLQGHPDSGTGSLIFFGKGVGSTQISLWANDNV